MAEKKTPVGVPATETPPQTESFSFEIPEYSSVGSTVDTTEKKEEGVLDWLWDDDEEEDEDRHEYETVGSTEDFKAAWSMAGKSTDPISVRATVADYYSPRSTGDIEKRVEEESGIVEVQRPRNLLKAGFESTVEAGSEAIDVVSEYTPEPVKQAAGYVTDKVISFGGNFVLPSLEYVDVPRAESWTEAYQTADRSLPDSDTFYGNAVSDIFSQYVGFQDSISRFLNAKNKFDSEEQESKYNEDVELLGKKIYAAFADGDLYDQAKEREGWFTDRPEAFGLLEGANATGSDLLDIAFPLDVMQRLKANSPSSSFDALSDEQEGFSLTRTAANLTDTTWYIDQLSDPTTRMGWGLALEVVADPLWFVGAAKGVITATVRGVKYNLGKAAAEASQIL